ncbi:MAG: hypothetical protein VB143_05135 [Burkholderia sp.]
MNSFATLFLAFAMSTDAFAAAIGKGATLHRPSLREARRCCINRASKRPVDVYTQQPVQHPC